MDPVLGAQIAQLAGQVMGQAMAGGGGFLNWDLSNKSSATSGYNPVQFGQITLNYGGANITTPSTSLDQTQTHETTSAQGAGAGVMGSGGGQGASISPQMLAIGAGVLLLALVIMKRRK